MIFEIYVGCVVAQRNAPKPFGHGALPYTDNTPYKYLNWRFVNTGMGVADFMYENDFFYAETPVPDVKFHVWNIQIHTSIQQRPGMIETDALLRTGHTRRTGLWLILCDKIIPQLCNAPKFLNIQTGFL